MMLNRKTAPVIQDISIQNLPEIHRFKFNNGLQVAEINSGTQEILKLDFIFEAGRYYETSKLASRVCAQLIKEGTVNFSSKELADKIEYVGASLRSYANLDHAIVSLTCLSSHLEKLIHMLREVIMEPSFKESEFEKCVRTNQQALKFELAKSDVQAYRILTEQIYGPDHPYGYNSTPELYDGLTLEQVQEHFKSCFQLSGAKLIISGRINSKHLRLIEDTFNIPGSELQKQSPLWEIQAAPYGNVDIKLSGAAQTSYRMGFLLFNRVHPDYPQMYLLNTILGGYFGSRLMKNIREEKGYTYNIYSALDLMAKSGYFYISADTSHELVPQMRKEIIMEIDRMRNELISGGELKMVKNYTFGSLLNYLDGPFNIAKTWKNLWSAGLDMNDFIAFIDKINEASPEDIRAMANKYFSGHNSYEVICGSKD